MTPDEKRQAICQALAHPETSQMSNRAIAQMLGVHHSSVNYWRRKFEQESGGQLSPPVAGSGGQLSPPLPNKPQYHPIAQTAQAISPLNPTRVRFQFMGDWLEGEAVSVYLNWRRMEITAVLVNHQFGQTQVPLSFLKVI